jgi:hypothetical protein
VKNELRIKQKVQKIEVEMKEKEKKKKKKTFEKKESDVNDIDVMNAVLTSPR